MCDCLTACKRHVHSFIAHHSISDHHSMNRRAGVLLQPFYINDLLAAIERHVSHHSRTRGAGGTSRRNPGEGLGRLCSICGAGVCAHAANLHAALRAHEWRGLGSAPRRSDHDRERNRCVHACARKKGKRVPSDKDVVSRSRNARWYCKRMCLEMRLTSLFTFLLRKFCNLMGGASPNPDPDPDGCGFLCRCGV